MAHCKVGHSLNNTQIVVWARLWAYIALHFVKNDAELENVMKNAIAIVSLSAATAAIGWTFGSGHLTAEAALTLILSWIGISWSCIQD